MAKTDFFLGFGNSILAALFGTLSLMGIALAVIVSVALIFISVRFMLAVTRAAQVYVDLNGADAATARAAADAASAPAAAPRARAGAATATAPKTAASKAASKPAAAKTAAAKPAAKPATTSAAKSASAKSAPRSKG